MKRSKKIIAALLAVIACLSVSLAAFSPAVNAKSDKTEITKIYCSASGIELRWKSVSGVSEYTVYRTYNGTRIRVKTVSGTAYSDKNLISGKNYVYEIETSPEVLSTAKAFTFIKAPETVTVTKKSDGINVKWSKVANASGYNIYRKAENGKYKKLAAVTSNKTSYRNTGIKNGKEYTYYVRSVSKDGCKSAYSAASKPITFLKVPQTFKVKNSPVGVTISWKKDTAPQSFEIARKVKGGDWETVGTVLSANSTFIDKKAPFGSKCYYKIRSISKSGESYYTKKQSLYAIDPSKPAIALTFDDGPYSPVTNQILDCLEKNGGRVTFFVVGSRVDTYKDCVKRASSMDCEIGCHTYNHAILTRLSAENIRKEISSTVKVIEKYSGKKVRVVRTPGGAVNDTVKANVKYPLVNWSIDTLDWQHRTTSKTVSAIKSNARDGAIVLMHDLYVPTGNAAVEIIPWLKANGYQLVTVSELFELKGINAKSGNLYTHG